MSSRPANPDTATPRPAVSRQLGALLAGALAAAISALILGEYAFSGATPYVAAVFFGLVVAEVTLTVARASSRLLVLTAALEAGGGLGWAVWISTAQSAPRPEPVPFGAWISIALGAVVAGAWVAMPAARHSSATGKPLPSPEPPAVPVAAAAPDAPAPPADAPVGETAAPEALAMDALTTEPTASDDDESADRTPRHFADPAGTPDSAPDPAGSAPPVR